MNVFPREVLVRISASSPLTCLIVILGILSLAGCGGSSSTSSSSGGGGQTPSVTIASFPSQIGAGANWQFSATATGTSGNQGVNWAVTTQNGGTIDSSGLYIAPTTGSFPLSVTVSVTSQANSAVTASASITITQTDPLGTAQGTAIIVSKLRRRSSHLEFDLLSGQHVVPGRCRFFRVPQGQSTHGNPSWDGHVRNRHRRDPALRLRRARLLQRKHERRPIGRTKRFERWIHHRSSNIRVSFQWSNSEWMARRSGRSSPVGLSLRDDRAMGLPEYSQRECERSSVRDRK